MNLKLKRIFVSGRGVFSELTDEQGNLIADVCEHAFQQPDNSYDAKVKPGTYTCVRGTHQLDHGGPFETFEVTGVTGHFGILYHPGNTEKDSDGCLLLGECFDDSTCPNAVLNSRVAFKEFMDLQQGLDSFTLEVV